MDLLALLNALVANIADLQGKLADAQKAADDLAAAKFAEGVASVVINPDLKFTQADIDKAFQDGVKSVGGTFSQADLDAAVKNAVDPLNAKIAVLQASVDGIPAQLEAQKASLKDAFKALLDSEDTDAKSKVDAL